MGYQVALSPFVAALLFSVDIVSGQERTDTFSVDDYDFSIAAVSGWVRECPPGHDEMLWLVRNREGPSENRVSFEVRVGAGMKEKQEEIGLQRLSNDFKNPKKKASTKQRVAGENIPLNTYSFEAGTVAEYPGEVTQALLSHGGILVDLRWFGSRGALAEAAPEIDRLLASVKWMHADWKPSDSQLAFLEAAQRVSAGLALVTDVKSQYLRAVSLDPKNTKARCVLGMAYLSDGRLVDAFAQFEAVSRLDPSNVQAWIGLGNVLADRGDKAGALKYYSLAVEHAPTSDYAQRELAASLVEAHRNEEALIQAESAKRLGWNQMQSLDFLIKSLKYQKEHGANEK